MKTKKVDNNVTKDITMHYICAICAIRKQVGDTNESTYV